MLKFAMALGVVLFVSLISLGWRSGIVVALAVPLTLPSSSSLCWKPAGFSIVQLAR